MFLLLLLEMVVVVVQFFFLSYLARLSSVQAQESATIARLPGARQAWL